MDTITPFSLAPVRASDVLKRKKVPTRRNISDWPAWLRELVLTPLARR